MDSEKKKRLIELRDNMKSYGYMDGVEELEDIFPEIKESKDEGIRKFIIDCIDELRKANADNADFNGCCSEAIAYLEKQKYKERYDRMAPIYEDKESFESALDKAWEFYNESASATVDGFEDNFRELTFAKGFREGFLYKEKQKEPHYSPLCNTTKDKIREYVANHFIADTIVKTDMKSIVKAMEEGVRLGKEEQKPAEKLSKEEYVKKFKALCDAYEIKLPNREYDIYGLCEDLHKLFGDIQKPAEVNNEKIELSDFESELFSAFSDGWQQYLRGEEVNVAQWAKEHSAELLNAAKQELKPAEWNDSVAKEMFIKALERAVEQTKKGYELTDCDKQSWWEDFKAYSGIKPVEWSEEDEIYLSQAIETLEHENYLILADRLKSLRPQPKQEWSEKEKERIRQSGRLDVCYNPEKYGLCHKTEWSEGEMNALNSIIDDYEMAAKSFCGHEGKIMFLKAIRDGEYGLTKQEWSEEDERLLNIIIDILDKEEHNGYLMRDDLKACVKLLKSLRPRPHTASIKDATKFGNLEYERGVKDGIQSEKSHQWKPNEEQMKVYCWIYSTIY